MDGGRRGKRAEVAISDKVIGTDCTIQRAGEEDAGLLHKCDGRDGCAVVCEGDEAESGIGGPGFHLAVITARCYGLTIRCVCKSVHAEIVSSLLENV